MFLRERERQSGYTILELMTVVVILGILLAVGIPGFSEWIANQKVRTAAESMLDGLQVARAEAVRRNSYTQFVLTTASGWRVITINPPTSGVACGQTAQLQTRSGEEGSSGVTVTATPANATSVTFTPVGWTTANCSANPLTQVNFAAPNSSRPLRIVITTGGGIRLCDPALAAGDPRGCSL